MTRKAKPEPFAARLKRLRLAAGLSVAQLAARAGLPRQTVHKAEAGSPPTLATARKIAAALDTSLAAFDGVTD